MVVVAIAAKSLFAENIPVSAGPGKQGQWSDPFDLGIIAINASLLQNGKVLFWQFAQGPDGGSSAELWDPTGTVTDVIQ